MTVIIIKQDWIFGDCKVQEWNRLIEKGIILYNDPNTIIADDAPNTKHAFTKMCKLFGRAYMTYLETQYIVMVKECNYSLEWYCKVNGDVPLSFIQKFTNHEYNEYKDIN